VKILVTGGSGFVGLPIVKKLLASESGFEILAITRNIKKSLPMSNNINWVELNLDQLAELKKTISDFKPEVFIHLAWQDIPDFSSMSSVNNLKRSINLFEIIWEINSCRKILVAGSCFEYNRLNGICEENEDVFPKDFFTWAKLSLLNYLLLNCKSKNIKLAWFRLFYVYGPNQRKGSLLQTLINDFQNNQIPSLNSPNNFNDFIYVEDIAYAFELSIRQDFESGVYNLGSGKLNSVLEIAKIAEQYINGNQKLSIRLEEITKESKPEIDFYASTKLTKKVFAWEAQVALSEGIQRTIYLNN